MHLHTSDISNKHCYLFRLIKKSIFKIFLILLTFDITYYSLQFYMINMIIQNPAHSNRMVLCSLLIMALIAVCLDSYLLM